MSFGGRKRAAKLCRGRWLRVRAVLCVAAAAVAAMGAFAPTAAAATYPDLRGDWNGGACTSGTLAQCEANPQYPHSGTWTEDLNTGQLYTGDSSNYSVGQISGCTVTWTNYEEGGSYVSHITETISSDGNSLTGSFSDNNGQSGPQFDFRQSGGPTTCPASANTLTVADTGSGTGTVSSSPPGINCGSTCSAAFSPGSQVTLTATPASGSTFAGWSGGGCSGTGTCVVTMNSAQSVTADFTGTATAIKGSQTQVMCTFVLAVATDTCTATVGDVTGSATQPTGTVAFSSDGGGVFAAGHTCNLARQQGDAGVATCSVQFLPPGAQTQQPIFPTITGDYSGDAHFSPSSGNTAFLAAGAGNGVYQQHIDRFNPPTVNVVSDVPLPNTSVTVQEVVTDDLSDGAACSNTSAADTDASPAEASMTRSAKKPSAVHRVKVVVRRPHARKGKLRLRLKLPVRALQRQFPGRTRVQVLVITTMKHGGRTVTLYQHRKLVLHEPGRKRARSWTGDIQLPHQGFSYWAGESNCGNLSVTIQKVTPFEASYKVSWTNVLMSCKSNTDEGSDSGHAGVITLTRYDDSLPLTNPDWAPLLLSGTTWKIGVGGESPSVTWHVNGYIPNDPSGRWPNFYTDGRMQQVMGSATCTATAPGSIPNTHGRAPLPG